MKEHEHSADCGCRPEDMAKLGDGLSRQWRARRIRGALVLLACAAAIALAVWLVGV